MFNDPTTQNTQMGGDGWNGPLQIADDATRGYFSFLTAKSVSKNVSQTPAATYAVLIAGVLLVILLLKKR